MARGKTFSPELITDRLADTFSAHGYEGTSLSMLVEESGLGKQSLYDTFGDKRDMYLRAVECVSSRYAPLALAMSAAENGRAAILLFFEELLKDCLSAEPSRYGCIVSAGLLEAVEDPAIRDYLRKKWKSAHKLLLTSIRCGQADASIHNQDPAQELADFFMTLMSGLRVSGRVLDARRLESSIRKGLRILDA